MELTQQNFFSVFDPQGIMTMADRVSFALPYNNLKLNGMPCESGVDVCVDTVFDGEGCETGYKILVCEFLNGTANRQVSKAFEFDMDFVKGL